MSGPGGAPGHAARLVGGATADLRARLAQALAPAGLDLVGVARPADWDARAPRGLRSTALLPAARALLVVGNGGRALWSAFLADLRADPVGLTAERHPLDAFVERRIRVADAVLGPVPRRWFFAGADTGVQLDFRLLGTLAGLGTGSRLGLLLHPTYGPWMGLRAACFLAADLPTDPPVVDDPCEGCPAPCVAACPGAAFPDGRWQVDRCAAHHLASDDCRLTCHARLACPRGAEHRYETDEITYHSDRAVGRRWLRAHLGLPPSADPFEGVGPVWASRPVAAPRRR